MGGVRRCQGLHDPPGPRCAAAIRAGP